MKQALYYAKEDLLPTVECHLLNPDMSPDMDTPVALQGEKVSNDIRKMYPSQVGRFTYDNVFTGIYRDVVYTRQNADGTLTYMVRLEKLS